MTCGFAMMVGMSYGALHGPVLSGFAQKEPGLGEVQACLTPSHCLPPRAGLQAAEQASATQANSQRAKKPPACHTDADVLRCSRRDRPDPSKGASLPAGLRVHTQQDLGCLGER